MNQEASPPAKREYFEVPSLSLGILVTSVIFLYLFYEYSPIGWLYYSLNLDRFSGRIAALVPEYNALNDAVMESLPVHPKTTIMPDTRRRQMPWEVRWPPGGPPGLVSLSACYKTNTSMDQVYTFYQDSLESNGWELARKHTDKYGYPLKQLFAREQACVYMRSVCNTGYEYEHKAVYEIVVYHDLNVLLPFPNIPQIAYWMGDVDHCP